jgi:hypothetical protein
MKWRLQSVLAGLLLAMAGMVFAQSGDVAMVTLLQGHVGRVSPMGKQPVEAFTKLRHGDLLALEKGSRVQLVYFENGRQETWAGAGKLEIAKAESTPTGLKAPEIKVLPALMVKQIVKTPVLDSQGRGGMMRLRSVATESDVEKVEENYRRMRQEAAANDLNADLYLLSSMYELREFGKVEQALADLQQRQKGNADVAGIVALYTKALKTAHVAPAP